MKSIILFLVLCMSFVSHVYAMTLTVGNGSGFDFQTIQAAIDFASNGDMILVNPGFYEENLQIVSKSLYIASLFTSRGDEEYINQTIIDGNRLSSVVTITNSQNVTIEGFTIQNGFAILDPEVSTSGAGGGIYINNSTAFINYNHIHNNHAGLLGGGITTVRSAVSFTANNVSYNMSMSRAGGVAIAFPSVSQSLPIFFNAEVGQKNNVFMNTARFFNDIHLNNTNIQDVHLGIGTFNYFTTWNVNSNTSVNFHFEEAYITEVDADVYVSAYGDDSNDGLTASTPLQSITKGMAMIMANEQNINTLHISDGIHSYETGTLFPIHLKTHVKFIGESMDNTIIDVGGLSIGIVSGMMDWGQLDGVPENVTLMNFTLKNLYRWPGRHYGDLAIGFLGDSHFNIYKLENIRYDERNTEQKAQGWIQMANTTDFYAKNIEIYRERITMEEYQRWAIAAGNSFNARFEDIKIIGGNFGIFNSTERRFISENSYATFTNVLIKDVQNISGTQDYPWVRPNVLCIEGSLGSETFQRGYVRFINSTFTDNSHNQRPFEGTGYTSFAFYNCIFYNNIPYNRFSLLNNYGPLKSSVLFSHNLYPNIESSVTYAPSSWDVEFINNINGEPTFLGNGPHPEMLRHDSLGIGMGTLDIPDYTFPEYDLAGNPRIVNGQISIGAYEYHPVELTADFTADVTSGIAPLTVQFIDLSIGVITAWAWDFTGDGIHISSSQNPVFIYDDIGTYTVSLSINDGEKTVTKPHFIVVTPPVNADFEASPTTGFAPLEVHFTCISIGAMSWEWDFTGDGITDSTEQNPVFTYHVAAVYDVTLTINGGESSITKPAFIDVTVDDIDETQVPLTTQLRGNYPNPFNPETTIYFDLASDSVVSIEIFNVRGQRIRILTNNHYYAGKHSVMWNGTDDSGKFVGSGIYFYRMRINGYTKTNRMVIIK